MKELTKAEQKRLAREEELIDLAIEIISKDGPGSLTLEKLTARSAYSKGTIYNHFSSKEDCLSALCCRAVSSIMAFFQRAATYDGTLREKALAIHYSYQLYSRMHPTLFQVVLSSKAPGVREKTSDERTERMDWLENQVNEFSDSMFIHALQQGEITNPTITAETASFANWAMSFGSLALANSAAEATAVSRLNQETILLNNINLLLDGMGWQPLSTQWDYGESWKRIAGHLHKLNEQPSENNND